MRPITTPLTRVILHSSATGSHGWPGGRSSSSSREIRIRPIERDIAFVISWFRETHRQPTAYLVAIADFVWRKTS
jgi:hypothetical protein